MPTIDERLRTLEQNMSGCRRTDYIKDHDRITQMVTILERNVEDNKILIEKVGGHSTSIETMSGNMNQVAAIVQDIVKHNKAKTTFIITVLSGVMIAIISALVIWCASILKQSVKADILESAMQYDRSIDIKPTNNLPKADGVENEKRRNSR